MPLTDIGLRNIKPTLKVQKLKDGDGLFLFVTPQGGKWWRFRYRFGGSEKMLSLGTYPEIPLRTARERRDEARAQVANGTDPSTHRKDKRRQERLVLGNTFAVLANEWFEHKRSSGWSKASADKARFYLDKDLLPALGDRPMTAITRLELVEFLRGVERRKAFNAARKMRGWLSQIFRRAVAIGVIEINPASELGIVAAPAPRAKHHASLPLTELPAFLEAMAGYQGSPLTRYAIDLLLLTGVRPGELRHALWSEIDFERALWSIPGERMKMKRPRIVPLPRQAVAMVRELRTITGRSPLLLPSRDNRDKPMSENTINTAFSRVGFKGRQTGHGFRHLISTALNEQGHPSDWIERQLAHGDADEIRGIYNHAQYIEQRRTMMQTWADHLDTQRPR